MSSDNWGGARNGAGRPRRKWDSGGPGTQWIMERTQGSPGGLPVDPEIWVVLEVGEDYIEFQHTATEEIITIRQD